MANIRIEKAKKHEAKDILKYIKGLAKYERMKKHVKATITEIEKHIFDKEHAHVIFLKEDDENIGFAVYYFTFSTFLARPTLYLEDFFVEDEHRGKGYGKMVLSYLANLALEEHCHRLEWNCLEWNKPSMKFYEKLGARPLRGWLPYRLDGDELQKLADETEN
ncbi:MAG: GNAT family N-acetyltransferase [Candidatus Izimaplasma sp.]|nr:GNAT family N-acetyltransferase [Candidatus Izimaplasma bacterium]